MSEEEDLAMWYFGEVLVDENDIEHWKIVENLIDKLQQELDKKDKIIKNAFRYVKKKQSQQYKYALSKIECDELIKILKVEEEK